MGEERYCPDCWRPLSPDAKYCPVCGGLAKVTMFEPPKADPKLWLIGPYLAIGAGFVSLIGAFLNFGTLLGFVQPYFLGGDSESSPSMPFMFLLLAFLGLAAFACGRNVGVTQKSREIMKSVAFQTAFMSGVGLVHLFEGIAFLNGTLWLGYFMILAVSVPMTTLSLVSLASTAVS